MEFAVGPAAGGSLRRQVGRAQPCGAVGQPDRNAALAQENAVRIQSAQSISQILSRRQCGRRCAERVAETSLRIFGKDQSLIIPEQLVLDSARHRSPLQQHGHSRVGHSLEPAGFRFNRRFQAPQLSAAVAGVLKRDNTIVAAGQDKPRIAAIDPEETCTALFEPPALIVRILRRRLPDLTPHQSGDGTQAVGEARMKRLDREFASTIRFEEETRGIGGRSSAQLGDSSERRTRILDRQVLRRTLIAQQIDARPRRTNGHARACRA